MSGDKACQDMAARHSLGTTARRLRDHLDYDRVYDSDLLIGGKVLFQGCTGKDVFAFDEAKAALAATPGFIRIGVIRKSLWEVIRLS